MSVMKLVCVNCAGLEFYQVTMVADGVCTGICNDCLKALQEDPIQGLEDRRFPNGPPPQIPCPSDILAEIKDQVKACEAGFMRRILDKPRK